MAPLIVLIVSAVLFRIAGLAGVAAFQDFGFVLRAALAAMFALTASAHWGKRRRDLIRMVPPAFPHPDLLVTITGVLELLGMAGLLLQMTARITCIGLVAMLIAMFPANVYATRHRLTIAGSRVPGLPARIAIQVVFLAALITAAWLK